MIEQNIDLSKKDFLLYVEEGKMKIVTKNSKGISRKSRIVLTLLLVVALSFGGVKPILADGTVSGASTLEGVTLNFQEASTLSVGTIPLWRMFHEGLNQHLWTTSHNEYRVLATRGWRPEGIAWLTPTTGRPVHRLFHEGIIRHHYTADQNEIRVLRGRGWNDEGPLFYCASPIVGPNEGIRMTRLFHAGTLKHLHTADANEVRILTAHGWANEGASFVGFPPPPPMPTAYIEGYMRLNSAGTSGTGSHVKFTMNVVGEHAFSFGIQRDDYSIFPGHRGTPVFMTENITGSSHVYTAYIPAVYDRWYHVRIVYFEATDTISFYVNRNRVGTERANFAGRLVNDNALIVAVGASARLGGDSVNADFRDVRTSPRDGPPWIFYNSVGIYAHMSGTNENPSFNIRGTSTLPPGLCWDTFWKAGFRNADGTAYTAVTAQR